MAEAGARIGTGDDADKGDADLYGREKTARVGGKVNRRLSTGLSAPDHRLQLGTAGGDNRKLRHGEETIDHHQREDDGDVAPGKSVQLCRLSWTMPAPEPERAYAPLYRVAGRFDKAA